MNDGGVTPFRVDAAVIDRIRPMAQRDLPVIAALHRRAMGRSLWARLGEPFLRTIYGVLLGHSAFRGFVYEEDGRVRGFIAGSLDSPGMMRDLVRGRFPRLAFEVLRGLIRNPGAAPLLLQTSSYFKRSSSGKIPAVRAESMFCSFEPELRGKRISGHVNKVLFDEMAASGCRFVKITTEADNAGAVRQLSSWGFSRAGTFKFYGKEMIAWSLDLETSPRVEPKHRFHLETTGREAD